MRKSRGAVAFGMWIFFILAAVAFIFGLLLIAHLLKLTEIPLFKKAVPAPPLYQVEAVNVFPEAGQTGTIFTISFVTRNVSGIDLVNIEIVRNEKIIDTVMLYDDGSHGDNRAGDGTFANIWDSSAQIQESYSVNLVINPFREHAKYEDIAEFYLYKVECVSVATSGDPDDKIDVTFVGHGYSAAELRQFREDVLRHIDLEARYGGLLSIEPLNKERNRFNFYFVNQPADLGCRLDCRGIESMVCCNDTIVSRIVSQCPADQVIVLVNDRRFCGTASFYAKVCTNSKSPEILIHEFGHSFGNLADEYDYATTYPGFDPGVYAEQFPNCDVEMPCPKWQGLPGTRCYASCGYSNLFRPTQRDCIMHRWVHKYCPVCSRQLNSLIAEYTPGQQPIEVVQPMPPIEDKTYLVNINWKTARTDLGLNNVFVTAGLAPDRKIVHRVDYTGKIMSFANRLLYDFSFGIPQIEWPFFSPEQEGTEAQAQHAPIFAEEVDHTLQLPYFGNAKSLNLYDKEGREVLSVDLGYFAEMCGDDICQTHENWLECPQDCPQEKEDAVCVYYKDGLCDPDCPAIDPDCKKPVWLVVLIAIGITAVIFTALYLALKKRKEKKKKVI